MLRLVYLTTVGGEFFVKQWSVPSSFPMRIKAFHHVWPHPPFNALRRWLKEETASPCFWPMKCQYVAVPAELRAVRTHVEARCGGSAGTRSFHHFSMMRRTLLHLVLCWKSKSCISPNESYKILRQCTNEVVPASARWVCRAKTHRCVLPS